MERVIGVGTSDFLKHRTNGLYLVDKSRFIIDVLTGQEEVLLFPRPRRFGKTLNLSMLRYFLERSDEDRQPLFQDLEVWQEPRARAHFQRHPVVFITFKDVRYPTWQSAFSAIRLEITRQFEAHRDLLETGGLSATEAGRFQAILSGEGDEALFGEALKALSSHLARACGERVVILIDEYDTPLHAAWQHGYYDEMVAFLRAFVSGGLKDNPHLFKGVLTGILRVAKESLFSGLNNVIAHSLLSGRYATSFGFTEPEVQAMVDRVGTPELMNGLRDTYNGYLFGVKSGHPVPIYNPWSVLSCLSSPGHLLQGYWLNTSSDDLLRKLLLDKGFGLTHEMERLMTGEGVEHEIDENIVLRDVDAREEALWSFLLFSGYLKPLRVWLEGIRLKAELAIPNREVRGIYEEMLRSWLRAGMRSSLEVDQLLEALLEGRVEQLEALLTRLLTRHMSLFDTGQREPEKLYQGFVLGLLVSLERHYEVRSNSETGLGRADVLIKPRQPGRPGVVLELKVPRKRERVRHALESGLEQIRNRKYVQVLEEAGATPIRVYVVVFTGKEAVVGTPEMGTEERH